MRQEEQKTESDNYSERNGRAGYSHLAPRKETGELARKGRPSQGLPYRPGVHKIVVTGNHAAIPIQWEKVLPRLW